MINYSLKNWIWQATIRLKVIVRDSKLKEFLVKGFKRYYWTTKLTYLEIIKYSI